MKKRTRSLLKLAILSMVLTSLIFSMSGCDTKSGEESSFVTSSNESNDNYVLREKNLNGEEIRFLVPDSSYAYYESFDIYAAEGNVGLINDSVYNRNNMVQEKYNCVIAEDKTSNIAEVMRRDVLAGDSKYDVYMPMLNDAVKLIGSNVMLDLNSLENLSLDRPWWDQNANKDLSMKGKLYFTTGDISTLDNDCTMVMFFNKKLITEYKMENPYDLVKSHKWTIDKVYEMSKIGTVSNGDGVWDNQDKYGLHVAFNAPHSFYFGAGGKLASMDEQGQINIDINSETNKTKLKDIFKVAYASDVLTNKTSGCDTFEEICRMFTNNQVIFTTFALIDIKQFRTAENFEFGILPYPLYDANQESYHNFISTGVVPVVAIPTTCENPENTAVVLEAMAYYSVDTLTKAYYEITLKYRDLQDKDSEEMLDIIFATRVYDLGYIYNWGEIGNLIMNMNARNSDNIASELEAIQSKVQTDIETTLKNFE